MQVLQEQKTCPRSDLCIYLLYSLRAIGSFKHVINQLSDDNRFLYTSAISETILYSALINDSPLSDH
jgi:hypothetical protein